LEDITLEERQQFPCHVAQSQLDVTTNDLSLLIQDPHDERWSFQRRREDDVGAGGLFAAELD